MEKWLNENRSGWLIKDRDTFKFMILIQGNGNFKAKTAIQTSSFEKVGVETFKEF